MIDFHIPSGYNLNIFQRLNENNPFVSHTDTLNDNEPFPCIHDLPFLRVHQF